MLCNSLGRGLHFLDLTASREELDTDTLECQLRRRNGVNGCERVREN